MQSDEFYSEGICALVKRWQGQFRKQEITLNNYEMLMLYAFFWHAICVALKQNLVNTNLVALLSEHPLL